MAHFAEISDDNKVIRVLVVPDEQEFRGEDYLANEIGLGGRWIQCSYNGKIRFNFPGFDWLYDPIDDAFIEPMWPCGHETLLLNDKKRWECADCEANTLQSRPTA